ncbi:MAG: hypothetical protein RL331_1496 [Bacteroidota bacterium]|jgi:hypothetical protein
MKPTLENIDKWLFDALEGNLSPAQEQALEDFIAQHPELELEQQAWLKTNYAASEVTFEPKAALYRKKQFGYKPFAAAAVLLLLLAVGFYQNQASPTKGTLSISTSKATRSKGISQQTTSAPSTSAPSTNSPSTNSPSTTSPSTTSPSTTTLSSNRATTEVSLLSNPVFLPTSTSSSPLDSSNPASNLATLKPLAAGLITGYRSDLRFEALAGVQSELELKNNWRLPALQRASQFAQKELGLSNNQTYDLLLPGKSNIDANISSVGTLSQTRFQSSSIARGGTSSEQRLMGQQFSIDGYSRNLRAGFGLQGSYKQYAGAAITDYEIGLIAAPKILLNRFIVLEPAARLRLGARYADAAKLQSLSFIEFENADLRAVQIDTTLAVGRRLFYKDLDLSLAIQTPILFVSAQLENTFKHFDYAMGNEQTPSNSRAVQQLTVSLGTQYASRNEKMRIAPYVQFRSNRLATQYLVGLQMNVNKWQLGASVADNKQYQAALGYIGKHSAIILQSCQQQLLTLNAPSYFHQVTFRFYSQPSRKARRYISL